MRDRDEGKLTEKEFTHLRKGMDSGKASRGILKIVPKISEGIGPKLLLNILNRFPILDYKKFYIILSEVKDIAISQRKDDRVFSTCLNLFWRITQHQSIHSDDVRKAINYFGDLQVISQYAFLDPYLINGASNIRKNFASYESVSIPFKGLKGIKKLATRTKDDLEISQQEKEERRKTLDLVGKRIEEEKMIDLVGESLVQYNELAYKVYLEPVSYTHLPKTPKPRGYIIAGNKTPNKLKWKLTILEITLRINPPRKRKKKKILVRDQEKRKKLNLKRKKH